MKIAVIAGASLKQELLAQGLQPGLELEWLDDIYPVDQAAGYIDLGFENTAERKNRLNELQPAVIMVNAVHTVLDELPPGWIRINGWNSFLKRPVTESAAAEYAKAGAEKILSAFGKKAEWVPDQPGFITARVVSMIINEAFFAFEEKVSTREEIDTALKLGTNYPYGPFEWCRIIGPEKVVTLLETLGRSNPRYLPAGALRKEAETA